MWWEYVIVNAAVCLVFTLISIPLFFLVDVMDRRGYLKSTVLLLAFAIGFIIYAFAIACYQGAVGLVITAVLQLAPGLAMCFAIAWVIGLYFKTPPPMQRRVVFVIPFEWLMTVKYRPNIKRHDWYLHG